MLADAIASGVLERSIRLYQDLLHKRVAFTRSRHQTALSGLQQAIELNHLNGVVNSDGWRDILQARAAEAAALAEYIAALKALSGEPDDLPDDLADDLEVI